MLAGRIPGKACSFVKMRPCGFAKRTDMSAVALIWILLLLFSWGEFQHNRREMALLKIDDAYIAYRGAARLAGASQICEAFSGGRTLGCATGRVGGGEARGWRRETAGCAVSLRAKRSNLGSRGNGDCFASLAMTQRGHRAPALLRKTEMRPRRATGAIFPVDISDGRGESSKEGQFNRSGGLHL